MADEIADDIIINADDGLADAEVANGYDIPDCNYETDFCGYANGPLGSDPESDEGEDDGDGAGVGERGSTCNGRRNNEVVLTAGTRDGKAVIRLERKYVSDIDNAKVHHVAGGPYKGILINKSPDGLTEVEPSEGRLEFIAYLVNQDRDNEALQDYWTLRFWFRGKADGPTKKRTFTQYFQDLMNPTNFPKNYIGFMKKALVLLKSYSLIKRVELEVEQVAETLSEDSIPPIKSFVTLFTPDFYQYNFLPELDIEKKTFLTFMLKAGADAHLALCSAPGDLKRRVYEIVIGADGNTKSMIRDGVEGKVKADALTMNILSQKDLRYFWISWGNHHVEVGRGAHYGYGRFLDWDIPPNRQFPVRAIAVTTDNMSRGQFEFAELLDVDTDYGKQAKKARVQRQLLWIAKKHRFLQCLEDAYPNTMSVADLLQQSRMRGMDAAMGVVMLKGLEKQGLVKEVEIGRWMRLQRESRPDSAHEVRLVKDMPQLTGREQPTVAIITSRYCEKLAVDAMIDDKTTFVKYKTEVRRSFVGESQVYTVGTIGRFKVVSTKLSRTPGSAGTAQTAVISAENTVTRLLGTFSKVEHVLLVGVGGGVPHYTDFSKHVRLGDVVVSVAESRNSPQYVHCRRVENIYKNAGYGYSIHAYDSRDRTLQNTATSLRSIVDADWPKPPPWAAYIKQGHEILVGQESCFKRPPDSKDKLFYRKSDGTTEHVEHPRPTGRQAHGHLDGQPNVRFGAIGSGKLVARTDSIRQDFAEMNNIKAFDVEFESVLESLEGNRNESFLMIRGICDYMDGTKKEWQPYAALVAAAYMKALIMALCVLPRSIRDRR